MMSTTATQARVEDHAAASTGSVQDAPRGARALWDATRPVRPVLIALIGLVAILSVVEPAFRTTENLENALVAVAPLWIVSMGMTFVLLSAGFDLSVGAIAALCGLLAAKLLESGTPGGLALLLTLVAGFAIGGLVNGTLIGPLGLSVFVVTLGTLTAFTGAVSLWSETQPVYVTASFVADVASARLLGVPVPIWLMVATLMAALYVQNRTYFGRDVFAIGGSQTAARLSGIRVPLVLMTVYGVSGLCAALAGVIVIGQVGAATPEVDSALALQAIAAVLIGGTALHGGAGGVAGTALGVLFIGVLANGLSIAGVQSFWQQVITGTILIVAVLGDRLSGAEIRRRLAGFRRGRAGGEHDGKGAEASP